MKKFQYIVFIEQDNKRALSNEASSIKFEQSFENILSITLTTRNNVYYYTYETKK